MSTDRPHTAVNIVCTSRSTNKMRGMLKGKYCLPYPMAHMLEIERWVVLFQPDSLYDEVKGAVSHIEPVAQEGVETACEGCGEVTTTGFEGYEKYFSDDEYLRILSRSRACSLECAIEYAFPGDYAPTVSEFKSNPDAYKTTGLVDWTESEVQEEFYS